MGFYSNSLILCLCVLRNAPFSVRLILDTYRSDQFTIVKSVGEHQPSLSPSPKFFVTQLNLSAAPIELCLDAKHWHPNVSGCSLDASHLMAPNCHQFVYEKDWCIFLLSIVMLAISMALAVRQYYTLHITWWRRFLAFLKATTCCHRASTRSDVTQSDMLTPDFGGIFNRQINKKGLKLTLRP